MVTVIKVVANIVSDGEKKIGGFAARLVALAAMRERQPDGSSIIRLAFTVSPCNSLSVDAKQSKQGN
jgi:hypothetical protein